MARKPAVAGMFYPGNRASLISQIDSFLQKGVKKRTVKGIISPHAGYIYSGDCAGKAYSLAKIPDCVVILGVDHHGTGRGMSVDPHDEWNTPLGNIEIDKEIRDKLIEISPLFNPVAGDGEHSIEVQIPFIQYINPGAKIVPIMVSTYDRDEISEASELLGNVIKNRTDDILVVASTDMSHYVSAEEAEKEDSRIIKKIKNMDPDGMLDIVISRRITMCGAAPVYMMLKTVKYLGAGECLITEYTNSGKISGDFDSVVGYLSAVLY